MSRNRWAIILFLTLFSLFFSVTFAENPGIELSPPMKDISIDPGTEKTFDILVANNSVSQDINLHVLLKPIKQEQEGNYRVVEESNPNSAVSWLELKKDRITLAPKSQAVVVVKVKVPRGASGSRAAAVVFEVVPDEKGEKPENIGGSTKFFHRLTTIVKVTANNRANRKEATITSLYTANDEDKRFASFGKNALAVVCTVANEGNVLISANGRLIIRNPLGRRVKDVPLGSGRGIILPGANVDLVSIFPEGLADGEYTLEVTVPYGGARPLQAKMNIRVLRKNVQSRDADTTQMMRLIVSPESLTGQLPSGAFRSFPVVLANQEKYPLKIHGSFKTIEVGPDGELTPSDETAMKYSVVPWLDLEQNDLVLAPGERKNIRVNVNIPKGVTDGTRYGSLIFDAVRADGKAGSPVTSISTPIIINAGKTLERKASIEEVGVFQDSKTKAWIFGGNLINKGNTHFRVVGKLVLRKIADKPKSSDGLEVLNARWEDIDSAAIVDSPGWLLPSTQRPIFAVLDRNLEMGEYQAEFYIDIGEKLPVRGTCIFKLSAK